MPKRIHGQQISIRKDPRTAKRVKIKQIEENLFQLPLERFTWTKSKSHADCVLCSFQAMKLITPEQASFYRKKYKYQLLTMGLSAQQTFDILRHKFGDLEWTRTMISDMLLNVLLYTLDDNHACFLYLLHEGLSGSHLVIIAKDKHGQMKLLDPQMEKVLSNQQDIVQYLEDNNFKDDTFFVLTYK
jgi:hypothetical protein